MSPDEQIQMLARMKERGQDTAATRSLVEARHREDRGQGGERQGEDRRRRDDDRRALPGAADRGNRRQRVALRQQQAVEAHSPAPRPDRRYADRSDQRRSGAGHGSGHRRRSSGTRARRRSRAATTTAIRCCPTSAAISRAAAGDAADVDGPQSFRSRISSRPTSSARSRSKRCAG